MGNAGLSSQILRRYRLNHKFKASLGFRASSRPTWATQWDHLQIESIFERLGRQRPGTQGCSLNPFTFHSARVSSPQFGTYYVFPSEVFGFFWKTFFKSLRAYSLGGVPISLCSSVASADIKTQCMPHLIPPCPCSLNTALGSGHLRMVALSGCSQALCIPSSPCCCLYMG